MTLLERYEIERSGTVYTVELFQHDTPHPTRRNFYAYVSDASENVVRTRDNSTDVLAKRAAENAISNWLRRSTPRVAKKKLGPPSNMPKADILRALAANPGMRLVELAREIGRLQGSVNGWLNKLRAEGLIHYRVSHRGDLVSKRWFLTEQKVAT